jgi:hypothetical protein
MAVSSAGSGGAPLTPKSAAATQLRRERYSRGFVENFVATGAGGRYEIISSQLIAVGQDGPIFPMARVNHEPFGRSNLGFVFGA